MEGTTLSAKAVRPCNFWVRSDSEDRPSPSGSPSDSCLRTGQLRTRSLRPIGFTRSRTLALHRSRIALAPGARNRHREKRQVAASSAGADSFGTEAIAPGRTQTRSDAGRD